VDRAVAPELLDSLLSDTHQGFVVIMRIIGVPPKVRMHTLDARDRVAAQMDPIITWEGTHSGHPRGHDGAILRAIW
jgi:hypothetical protein